MPKDWIGQQRIYLSHNKQIKPFCWISMEQDGSLLFAFSSKALGLTELGISEIKNGRFVDKRFEPVKEGYTHIKDAKHPHVSLHPTGIAHIVNHQGKVDEWHLDWFPVIHPEAVLFAFTGEISKLEKLLNQKETIR